MYPKSFYPQGDWDGDRQLARNPQEEAYLREKGYRCPADVEEREEPEKRKPGRPRKVEQ